MKTLLLSAFIVSNLVAITPSYAGNSSRGGVQTPAQRSANIIKAITDRVLASKSLRFHSISKISVGDNDAKVELTNEDDTCLAIPYIVKNDPFGDLEVEVNMAAIAICD